MFINNLQVNHMSQAIGIAGENLRITWTLEGGISQSGYHIRITGTRGEVYEEISADTDQMYCNLQNRLPSKIRATLVMTVTDQDGVESPEASMEIVTGPAQGDWKAVWINPELVTTPADNRRASYLRKKFVVSRDMLCNASVYGAYIYATCHGLMDIRINGMQSTNKRFMPGTQQYNKRIMIETIEVSELLHEGENEILVVLGDGWYRGTIGFSQRRDIYGKDIALLLQMEIDGQVCLYSDDSWQATQDGPLGRNDFMKGEEYDATKLLTNAIWHSVRKESFGYDKLILRDTIPMVEHETFRAKLITTPNGAKILDFGQNLVGYVRFSLVAEAGEKLRMIHGEVLDGEGNFTVQNFQDPTNSVLQQIDYICQDGQNEYCPTMTYMGFRYVKIEADFDIHPENFTAVAVYSDMRVTSSFECGVAEVNQLFRNAVWSMKGNFLDVPTDCPTREKSGYSGDCQAFIHTAMYLMDCYSVYAKWIREQAAGQYSDGLIPQIAPKSVAPEKKDKVGGFLVADGGIGWADSFEVVPYRLAKRYGDDSLIREIYESLRKWTEYEIKRAGKTRLINKRILPRKYRKYMIDTGWMWGEWLEPNQDDVKYMKNLVIKGDPEVGTAFYYQHLTYMAEMAKNLGRTKDYERYAEIAAHVKEAYRAVYLTDGRVTEEKRQCRYVRPIAHGLLTEEENHTAASDLAIVIAANDHHLNTGFLTTHELCRSLSNNGQTETAYTLLLQKDKPGWLHAVTKGCTTIPESWDCFDKQGNPKNSFNHYSYGAICGWLMDSACGIQLENGRIIISPHPDERLGFARASYDSPFGKIVSAWKYEEGKVLYHIEIPSNMSAEINIEGRDSYEVETGVYDF